ncbi:MAG: response regulator [Spirochaetes bacterium]|nr:response regulator [Spirochaetota bacterium]
MELEREIIIMVDDDPTYLTVVKNTLADKYDIFTVPSGSKLFQILEKITPSLILLDIEMPGMSGYDVIRKLKNTDETKHIPVIFFTATADPKNEVKGLDSGAVDYITKPFSRELLLKRIELHLLLEIQKKELVKYSKDLEEMVNQKTQEISELHAAILKTIAELVESRDDITGKHIEKTQKYLFLLVKRMFEYGVYIEEISKWNIDMFVMSSQLHDVGKISIRDDILTKKGKLTDEEFEEMKKHSLLGAGIIEKIEKNTTKGSAFLKYAKLLTTSHHEKWNGTGYPLGLKGKDIPLQGRMMALVDVYDALTSRRPYKKAFSHEESVKIIEDGAGSHFDPLLVEVFLKHEAEFKNISIGDFVDVHTVSTSSEKRLDRYLKIFINGLLKSDSYRDEVSKWDIDLFLISAQLYDSAKANVKDEIFSKTEKLTKEDIEEIKKHENFGIRIIQQIKGKLKDENLLSYTEALAISYHEKWDGTGYPHGLKGKDIPLQGRIMAIVDVYNALTSDRPYRKMFSHTEAVEIIKKSYSGTYFDPELVNVFLEREKEFEKKATNE